jgi:hypothetical protein
VPYPAQNPRPHTNSTSVPVPPSSLVRPSIAWPPSGMTSYLCPWGMRVSHEGGTIRARGIRR